MASAGMTFRRRELKAQSSETTTATTPGTGQSNKLDVKMMKSDED